MDMDVIKADLNSGSYNNCRFPHSKFNFIGMQQDAEPTVMRATQFTAKSRGDVTVIKDEVHFNTAQDEIVAGVKGEIQHIQEGHVLQVKDDHYVTTKQEDEPVEKNGVWLITTQGKGLSDPPTEQVGVDLYLRGTLNLIWVVSCFE
jgi:hypothetical protein